MKRDDKTRQSLQAPSTPIALEVVLESGAAEEDITPIELWRRYKKFHPDKGWVKAWIVLQILVCFGLAAIPIITWSLSAPREEEGSRDAEIGMGRTSTNVLRLLRPLAIACGTLTGLDILRNFNSAYRVHASCCDYTAVGPLETRSRRVAARSLAQCWWLLDLVGSGLLGLVLDLAAGRNITGSDFLRLIRILRAIEFIQILRATRTR